MKNKETVNDKETVKKNKETVKKGSREAQEQEVEQ